MSKIFVYLALLGFCTPTQAADYWSARTTALGGAGHAGPSLTDTIYMNPSYISYQPVHAIAAGYLVYGGGTTVGPQGPTNVYGDNYNISASDGSPDTFFQAGVGFTRRTDANFVHIGASKTIINQLGVGLGTKFIFPNDGTHTQIIDGTFSISGLPVEWFQASFIVDNVIESNDSLIRGFYRQFILGTRFNVMKIMSIYLDPHLAPDLPGGSPWGLESGLEIPFFADFSLRGGYFNNAYVAWEPAQGGGWSAGLGWMGPKISIDWGIAWVTNGISANANSFSVTIYF